MSLVRFVWAYLPPLQSRYLAAIFLTIIEGFLVAAPPTAVGVGFVVLAKDGTISDVAPLAALCFFAVILRIFVVQRAWGMGFSAGDHAAETVRNQIVEHMRKVPLGALSGRWTPARLATLITEDGRWFNETATFFLIRLFNAIVATLAFLFFAAFFEPLAALGILLAIGGGLVMMRSVKPVAERIIRTRNELIAEAILRIGEFAEGVAVFRAFGQSGSAQKKFKVAATKMNATALRVAPILVPLEQSGAALVSFAGPLAIVLIAISQMMDAYVIDPVFIAPALFLTLAAATAFTGGILRNLMPLELGSRARINISGFLDVPTLVGTSRNLGTNVDIVFDEVSFRYAEDKPDAVRNASLTARQGRVTAIVGPSGAGKSTLISLLLRFHDPSSGNIRIGSVDTMTTDPASVQSLVSLVSQDVHLFRDSLRANLLLGDPGASEKRLMEVVDAARLGDLVDALPHGLDTMLGDTGRTLSGGERQRVAIARALLKDAPIIVLDEATSAMDPITEHAIQQAIATLEKGRTVIVIAHRLHTVVDADEIIVFDKGRVQARGDHAKLLAESELYARLWEAQRKAAGWRIR